MNLTLSRIFLTGLIFLLFSTIGYFQTSTDTTVTITKDELNLINQSRGTKAPAGTTSLYRATVLNTNFTIPIIRFNTASKGSSPFNPVGSVSLFNSIGAGISINWGRLSITKDQAGNVINTEMTNTIGLQQLKPVLLVFMEAMILFPGFTGQTFRI